MAPKTFSEINHPILGDRGSDRCRFFTLKAEKGGKGNKGEKVDFLGLFFLNLKRCNLIGLGVRVTIVNIVKIVCKFIWINLSNDGEWIAQKLI
jgi:hypothetical protein